MQKRFGCQVYLFLMALPMISGKKRILLRAHIILKMIFWWQPETLPNVILLERIILKGTVANLALAIFDSMKKVHGMGDRERLLLQIAVQLHDCGKYISMGDVAECSYQIIMATGDHRTFHRRTSDHCKMRCATIPQNLFISWRDRRRQSEWIVPYIFLIAKADCNPSYCKCHGSQPLSEGKEYEGYAEGQNPASYS